MFGLPAIVTVNSLGLSLGAIPDGTAAVNSVPKELTTGGVNLRLVAQVPPVSGSAVVQPGGEIGRLLDALRRSLDNYQVPTLNGRGSTPYTYPRILTPLYDTLGDNEFRRLGLSLPSDGKVPIRHLGPPALRLPFEGKVPILDLRPPGPPVPPSVTGWGLLNKSGKMLFLLDLLSQSGHGPSVPQRPPQQVAVLPVIPGPRGTFYWNPPTSDSSGFWNNFGNWSVGQPTSNSINGVLVYTNVNLGGLVPGPGDPVVFDGVLQNSTRRLCVFVDPPPSGSLCSSMLFANGWNGTLQLTGTVRPFAPGTAIANLSVDTGSNPTITCDLGDLRLMGVCSLPHGTFTVRGANLYIAPDAVVTVGQINFSAGALILGPTGKSTLIVTGGGINSIAPQAGPIMLTSSSSALGIFSNATIDGFIVNHGGLVQIGTPAGAGDDMTQYTLLVKSYSDGSLESYRQGSGSLKIYNGGQLSLAGGFTMAGGTVSTGYTGVSTQSQSFITAGLGKTGNGLAADIRFTGGTISPGSLDSNPYCNLRLFLSGGGAVSLNGATLALPVNGQTPGTGASISSSSKITLSGSNTLQVTDGSGAGIVSGSWTLFASNAPSSLLVGDFTTKTLPAPTEQIADFVGTNYVFRELGSAVATACSVVSTNTALSAVVTNSSSCDGTYALSYDSGSTRWKDSLTAFGNQSGRTPGLTLQFQCGTVIAGTWYLSFNATLYTPTAPPAGHGAVVYNNVDMTFFGGSATSTVTITV